MLAHRFKVGDTVRIVRSAHTNPVERFLDSFSVVRAVQPDATWEVVRLLPRDDLDFQYQIRGRQGGPTQVVREAQLASA